jgi:hypothetical protein
MLLGRCWRVGRLAGLDMYEYYWGWKVGGRTICSRGNRPRTVDILRRKRFEHIVVLLKKKSKLKSEAEAREGV